MEPAVHLAPLQVAHWYSMLEPRGFPEPFITLSASALMGSELLFMLSCTSSNLEDKHPPLSLSEQAYRRMLKEKIKLGVDTPSPWRQEDC